ncbi:MAG: hypothetical protein Q9185_000234 [Variospora sp. 1 TL-2023]
MDPLYIAASAITVAALAEATCRAFVELRELCKTLPGRLHAISNEVTDIKVVLIQVAKVFKERASPIDAHQQSNTVVPRLLVRAEAKLEQLHLTLRSLIATCDRAKFTVLQAYAWRKEQPQLRALQAEINTIKCNLNVALGASNSRDMLRIRLDLESLSAVVPHAMDQTQGMREDVMLSLAQHNAGLQTSINHVYDIVDQRIAKVEHMIKKQGDRLQSEQSTQIGPYLRPILAERRRRSSESASRLNALQPSPSEGVRIRLNQYASNCSSNCRCACHIFKRSSTPTVVDSILGQMFVSYAGIPLLNEKCDVTECDKSQIPYVNMEYWFPLGLFWSQIVRLQLGYQSHLGPQVSLSMLRRVPDSAPCVKFAVDGSIHGLKDLFKRGLASPKDVSSTRGYSILCWALYAKQYQTCKFLVNAGADPDYRIVLGLSMMSLEEELILLPEHIDAVDALGRSPLIWAAARGHVHNVALLLGAGANPNLLDVQFTSAVSYAAERDHTVCIRLLLEAGADPDPPLPEGVKVGSGLNCAARNATDPLVMKKITPLIHAAQKDKASFAILLLEYGANINATTTLGQTSLTTAITHNSHKVLQLLLDRWFEYTECPRLKGTHLLQIAAMYADTETIEILKSTDHFALSYDRSYIAADFATLLHKRWDFSEKLSTAFEELIQLIGRQPDEEMNSSSWTRSNWAPNERMGQPNLTESGLLLGTHRSVQHTKSYIDDEEDSSEQSFDDAFDTVCGSKEDSSAQSFDNAPDTVCGSKEDSWEQSSDDGTDAVCGSKSS